MRKLFTLFFAFAASAGTMFASVTIDGIAYNLNETELTAEVISGSYGGYSGDIVISASVEYNAVTYSVKTIGGGAFYACSNLTSVVIPNSVTSIGEGAFEACSGLTSINIPNSVTSIGHYAFYGCSSLTSVTIGNSVTRIGDSAFAFCIDLTSIEIPNSVTSIGYYAFGGCSGLTSINIPNSVTSIGYYAFYDCTGLTSINIPNSVTSIGEETFMNCTGLTSITIPTSVTSIGGGAFSYCTGLTSITSEALIPPTLGLPCFVQVDRSIPLYVPAGSEAAYRAADQWKDFTDIRPIGHADVVEVAEPQAQPTSYSVVIEWPTATGAETYTIEIRKGSELVCTLTFDAAGQLLSINYAAPSRNGSVQAHNALQIATGWQYTINGLDPNTEYTYTVIAKKSDDSEVYNKTIPFKTKSIATSIDQISNQSVLSTRKILRDGQLFILRDGKIYNALGVEVK